MNYVIVTGYWSEGAAREAFAETWVRNTLRFASPSRIYGICAGCEPPRVDGISFVAGAKNLGHIHHLIHDPQNFPNKLCGWTMSTLMGAMLAYHAGADMIYKEQDCLAFGPWVRAMYMQAGMNGARMLFGRSALMGVEQSLIWIRHDALLEYVGRILAMPEGDGEVLPEAKYMRLIDEGFAQFFEFGYGRDRPVNFDSGMYYIQQASDAEWGELKARKLI
jgi:hypothetical protein